MSRSSSVIHFVNCPDDSIVVGTDPETLRERMEHALDPNSPTHTVRAVMLNQQETFIPIEQILRIESR